jgi:hypothetical protein
MAGSTISVNSVEIALTSEMGPVSARKMKAAYLGPATPAGDKREASHPRHSHQGRKNPGPDATLYLTTAGVRTRAGAIKKILQADPANEEKRQSCFFYTLTTVAGIQLDDPSTTRFINAMISLEVPRDTRILDYSPKGREVMATIGESGACGISVTPSLDVSAMGLQEPETTSRSPVQGFLVRTGPEGQFSGTYSGKGGFRLRVPLRCLLEYQGMQKNGHAVDWELYPPMIPRDGDCTGKENLAVFSLIVGTPRRCCPEITARIESRVKGDLWGVIHLTGSGTIPAC